MASAKSPVGQGAVWLGDLAVALSALQANDSAAAMIAAALGFELLEAVGSEDGGTGGDEPPTDPDHGGPGWMEPDETSLAPPEPPSARRLTPVRTEAPPQNRQVPVAGVQALDGVSDEHLDRRPPFVPLFSPLRTFPIIERSVATVVPGREVDIDALIDKVAKRRPLDDLPRRPRRTLHFGVQLLVDIGEAMQPFRRDQDDMVARIRSVVGKRTVSVLHYAQTTDRGAGPGPVGTWRQYAPPRPGIPVLVLGDLGLGPKREPRARRIRESWLRLAAMLRRRGSPLIAFVPYDNRRWPATMASAIELVEWDRDTDIERVAAAIRRYGG